jgi:hypothetical protein
MEFELGADCARDRLEKRRITNINCATNLIFIDLFLHKITAFNNSRSSFIIGGMSAGIESAGENAPEDPH